jgi:ABC-type oligopeptide transport system substrate-binding subunit
VGDYPDAENFLQLFYGPNAGSCNRCYYSDKKFDKMFAAIKTMPDSPARTARYADMAKYLVSQCPWIFSDYPVSYRLTHGWVENYVPHNFCFSRWKYLSLDPAKRERAKSSFKPLNFSELRK